jgi:DnaJ-class molecular chaperone
MAYCPKCGKPVGVRDTYCKSCGERLAKQKSQDIWKRCEFCRGTGEDPGDGDVHLTMGPCRVCKGAKGGYFSEESSRCKGECRGNGRIKVTTGIDIVDNFRPCHDCGGWGWAKP